MQKQEFEFGGQELGRLLLLIGDRQKEIENVYESRRNHLAPQKVVAYRSLLEAIRQEQIEPLSNEISTNASYKWLSATQEYQKAFSLFDSVAAQELDGRHPAAVLLKFLFAVTGFFTMIVGAAEVGWKPLSVPKKKKDAAVRHASQLLMLLNDGVELKDYSDRHTLQALLIKLQAELESTIKRDYSGPLVLESHFLKSLATFLLILLPGRTDVVVEMVWEISGLCDRKPSHRSIQRYVYEAQTTLQRMRDKYSKNAME